MKTITTMLFLCVFLLHAADDKLKIAILTLKNANGIAQGETELISDRLRNEFFSTGAVEVMERDQMLEILKEQGLQQAGLCTDDGCMVELGKMLGVQRLITGSIGKLGSLFMITVRSIDVTTGKIMYIVSEDIKGDIEDVITTLSSIAHRICGSNSTQTKFNSTVSVSVTIPDYKNQSVTSIQKDIPDISSNALPCDGEYYMQTIDFPKSILGFPLEKSVKQDIEEELSDALGDAFDKDIHIGTPQQLKSSSCPTKTLKFTLLSYTTKTAPRDQIVGTITVTISLFDSPAATAPLTTITIEKSGDRHWGLEQPLLNAIDEITDVIEDDLESKFKKFLK